MDDNYGNKNSTKQIKDSNECTRPARAFYILVHLFDVRREITNFEVMWRT